MVGVIYVRVSSKEQADGFSLDAQLELLHTYAGKQGIRVVRVFQEAETAKRAGRTAFREMLAFIKDTPDVKAILVEKTDRLYRNFHDYVLLDYEKLGLEVHLVKEGEVLSKTSRSHEKLVHGLKVVLAKNYCDNLSEEVVKGLDQKARGGTWPTYAPIGYRNLPDRTMVPDQVEAPLVRRAFELAASGTYTLQRLRGDLFDAGLRSRRAKRMLGKEALRRILANPIYTGEFIWKNVRYQGTYEPLITMELFDRAQAAMGLRARPRMTKHNFAFTGLLVCGHCGSAITAERQKGRYTYYRCAKQCDHVEYVPEALMSQLLGEPLKRIKVTQEVVDWTKEALLGSHREQAEYHRQALSRLNARRAKVTSYLDQAYTDRVEGRLPEDVWSRRSEEWERERQAINTQLQGLENAKKNYLEAGVRLIELAQVAHDLYVSQTPHEQRRLVDVVLSNCRLVGRSVEYDMRKPFDLLVDLGDFSDLRGGRDLNDENEPPHSSPPEATGAQVIAITGDSASASWTPSRPLEPFPRQTVSTVSQGLDRALAAVRAGDGDAAEEALLMAIRLLRGDG